MIFGFCDASSSLWSSCCCIAEYTIETLDEFLAVCKAAVLDCRMMPAMHGNGAFVSAVFHIGLTSVTPGTYAIASAG